LREGERSGLVDHHIDRLAAPTAKTGPAPRVTSKFIFGAKVHVVAFSGADLGVFHFAGYAVDCPVPV